MGTSLEVIQPLCSFNPLFSTKKSGFIILHIMTCPVLRVVWYPENLVCFPKRGSSARKRKRERELLRTTVVLAAFVLRQEKEKRRERHRQERVVAPLTLFHQGLVRPAVEVVVVQHAAREHVIVPLVVQWDPFFGIHFLRVCTWTVHARLIMTTHLTSWSSKMSFQRGKGQGKSSSRSNSPLSNNSPSLSSRPSGLRSQSQAPTTTAAANAVASPATTNSTLSLTEKDFVDKGKLKIQFYLAETSF